MAYKIVWAEEARATYFSIIDYLTKEWTEKEIVSFATRVHEKLALLTEHPAIGKPYKKRHNIHKTQVHKHVSLVYHIRSQKKEIVLLTFWDNRQAPTKRK
jgi:plasmid stabilization system protein ParE